MNTLRSQNGSASCCTPFCISSTRQFGAAPSRWYGELLARPAHAVRVRRGGDPDSAAVASGGGPVSLAAGAVAGLRARAQSRNRQCEPADSAAAGIQHFATFGAGRSAIQLGTDIARRRGLGDAPPEFVMALAY